MFSAKMAPKVYQERAEELANQPPEVMQGACKTWYNLVTNNPTYPFPTITNDANIDFLSPLNQLPSLQNIYSAAFGDSSLQYYNDRAQVMSCPEIF